MALIVPAALQWRLGLVRCHAQTPNPSLRIFLFLPTSLDRGRPKALMDEVTAEIKAVCVKLEEVEAEIKIQQARAEHEEVAALRKKEEQLRTKEEQLRSEKLLLLERERGALV